jgi:flagellar hook-associated protein 3 FlgL
MRIDTSTYLSNSLVGIQNNQSNIARLSQQISTGLRMQSSKDDPVSAVKAMELSDRISMRTQYSTNQTKAELDLNYSTIVLQEMGSALDEARGIFLSVSASQTSAVRDGYAEKLKGVFNHLMDLANTRNTSGEYIFSGTATNLKPFANPSASSLPVTPQPTTTFGDQPLPGPLEASAMQQRQIEINTDYRVQTTDNITSVLSFEDPSFVDPAAGGDTHDVLQNLANAIVGLKDGTINNTELKDYVSVVAQARDNLLAIQQRVAGALTEIKDTRASTEAVLLLERNALSDLTQVDKAAAIVELQSRQTTLEAISRAYSVTSSLSLFNYIS